MKPTDSFVHNVGQFMRIGGQTVGKFNPDQSCLYMGLQLEELAEKLVAIRNGSITKDAADRFDIVIEQIQTLSDEFKRGMHRGNIMRADAEAVLDADIDLAWVSIGAVMSFSNDPDAALHEVARANLAKFPNGEVVRDNNGKVMKPKGWKGPDLSPFVQRP